MAEIHLRDQIRAAIKRVGWSETARRSGYDRITLHRNFGERAKISPKLGTILAVLPAVGLSLSLEPVGTTEPEAPGRLTP